MGDVRGGGELGEVDEVKERQLANVKDVER